MTLKNNSVKEKKIKQNPGLQLKFIITISILIALTSIPIILIFVNFSLMFDQDFQNAIKYIIIESIKAGFQIAIFILCIIYLVKKDDKKVKPISILAIILSSIVLFSFTVRFITGDVIYKYNLIDICFSIAILIIGILLNVWLKKSKNNKQNESWKVAE